MLLVLSLDGGEHVDGDGALALADELAEGGEQVVFDEAGEGWIGGVLGILFVGPF